MVWLVIKVGHHRSVGAALTRSARVGLGMNPGRRGPMSVAGLVDSGAYRPLSCWLFHGLAPPELPKSFEAEVGEQGDDGEAQEDVGGGVALVGEEQGRTEQCDA